MRRILRVCALSAPRYAAAVTILAACVAMTTRADPGLQRPTRQPDVPYLPTPPDIVDAMLDFADVTSGDVVYDLGSGDGRIVIAAARAYRARAVGVELDPKLVGQARANVASAGVGDLVTILQADVFATDLSRATVVTLYLLPSMNERLRPKLLRELRPGARIVSHDFALGDWQPQAVRHVRDRRLLLWRIR